jgi:hypothetical protein
VLAAVGLVSAIWRLGAPARAATRRAASPAGRAEMFGGALRPPRYLRFAFGSPEGRAELDHGFAPGPASELPLAAELVQQRGSLEFELAPDPVATELILLARASSTSGDRLAVHVNDADVGTLTLGAELSLQRVTLPAAELVADRNRIDFTRLNPSAKGSTFVAAWLEPASIASAVDLRTSASVVATHAGWSSVQAVDGRQVRRTASQGQVTLPLRPLPTEYAFFLVGRNGQATGAPLEVGVSLQGKHLGEIQLGGTWQTRFLPVATVDVPRGDSLLELLLPQSVEGDLVVERLGLTPLRPELLLDIGRPAARPYLASGVSFDEILPDRDGAWSEGSASHVTTLLAPADEAYVLSLAARALYLLAPLSVRVEVNGVALGAVTVDREFGIQELKVPRGLLKHGPNDLALSYARTMAPAHADPHSTDARELAIFLDWLELRPTSQGASLATTVVP